jgi:hypothetical protein
MLLLHHNPTEVDMHDTFCNGLFAMKRKAIERCPGPVAVPTDDGRWHTSKDIIQWLDDL